MKLLVHDVPVSKKEIFMFVFLPEASVDVGKMSVHSIS